MPLTDAQVDRYSRQIILPEVGGIGQEKLLAARVQIGGAGTVAAWAARYLVAAGVGEVVLEPRLAEGMRASLAELNPDCRVEAAAAFGGAGLPAVLLAGAGDAAIATAWGGGVPTVVTRASGAAGELTMLSASHPSSACPACLAWERGDAEPEGGAPLSAAALVAALAATEVLKLLLGVGKGLFGRRVACDARTQSIEESRLACRPDCGWRAR